MPHIAKTNSERKFSGTADTALKAAIILVFCIYRKGTPMATIDTIKDILQENLDIDPADVNNDSTFDSLGVDSLDMVELICELEERCQIEFGEPEGLNTIAELVAYIDSL